MTKPDYLSVRKSVQSMMDARVKLYDVYKLTMGGNNGLDETDRYDLGDIIDWLDSAILTEQRMIANMIPVMMKSMTVSDRISPELRERFAQSPFCPDVLDEMLILYEQGQSYTGIARKMEISYPTVKKYIEIAREYGFFDKGC